MQCLNRAAFSDPYLKSRSIRPETAVAAERALENALHLGKIVTVIGMACVSRRRAITALLRHRGGQGKGIRSSVADGKSRSGKEYPQCILRRESSFDRGRLQPLCQLTIDQRRHPCGFRELKERTRQRLCWNVEADALTLREG